MPKIRQKLDLKFEVKHLKPNETLWTLVAGNGRCPVAYKI